MSLLTMGIIGGLLLVVLFIGIIINDNNEILKYLLITLSAIGLFSIGLFGFGMHATEDYDKYMIETIKPDTIVKSKYVVYVEFEEYPTIEYTSHEDYMTIDSTITFYLIHFYNYYGKEKHTQISIDEEFSKVKQNIKIEWIGN